MAIVQSKERQAKRGDQRRAQLPRAVGTIQFFSLGALESWRERRDQEEQEGLLEGFKAQNLTNLMKTIYLDTEEFNTLQIGYFPRGPHSLHQNQTASKQR